MYAYHTTLRTELLAAISHPNRVRMLEELRGGPRCVTELALALNLAQPNLSRHLKILVQAGVLVADKEGVRTTLHIADDRVYQLLDLAADITRKRASDWMKSLAE